MFRVTACLIAWLVAAPAWAFLPGQPVGMLNPQVQPANASAGLPAVDDKLGAGGYPIAGGVCAEWGHQVPCNNHYSTTRSSPKYVSASDGLYASVPANVFSLGSNTGGLIEEVRTNDALWSRDMTNAAWVKTTMTTALNAVGIDGTANSATTLTASGALAMAVQTITLASQGDNYSVFLKRVTGSGTVSICLGVTACVSPVACTVTSTTTFTRCTTTATVLNPIVGVQISTNGDSVIADFNQMEPGGFATSPMLTTSAATTRQADAVTATGALFALANSPQASLMLVTGILSQSNSVLMDRDHNTNVIAQELTATSFRQLANNVAITSTLGSGNFTTGPVKSATTWSAALGGSAVSNNGTLVTNASAFSGTATSPTVGSYGAATLFIDGPMTGVVGFLPKIPDVTAKALTQ